jgi:hypothetical protein
VKEGIFEVNSCFKKKGMEDVKARDFCYPGRIEWQKSVTGCPRIFLSSSVPPLDLDRKEWAPK